jgi:hypothetical protein
MTKPLADDIACAISCVQDYLDTIDCVEQQEHYDTIRLTIERLFQFYYQLVGFDPYEHQMNIAKKVMTEDSESLRNLNK